MNRKYVRLAIGAILGAIAMGAASPMLGWGVPVLVGWDVFAAILAGHIWWDFSRHSAAKTASTAKKDDMNHTTLDTLVVAASIASLAGVVSLLSAKNAGVSHAVFGLVSIVTPWTLVHTLYTVRYTSEYYRADEKGIDFGSSERPTFLDFAYIAFAIGMTYQVSDTTISASRIRRVALGHALVSLVFVVVIIASTINTLVSLASG